MRKIDPTALDVFIRAGLARQGFADANYVIVARLPPGVLAIASDGEPDVIEGMLKGALHIIGSKDPDLFELSRIEHAKGNA